MEKQNPKYRNITLSTKLTAQEKIMLQRLADEKGVTISEFTYNIVMCFYSEYDYIGRDNPKEEKLERALVLLEKKINRLMVDLENADYRVEIEMKRAQDAINKKDELAFITKELTAKMEDLKKTLKEREEKINLITNQNSSLNRTYDEQNSINFVTGAAGLIIGGLAMAFTRR